MTTPLPPTAPASTALAVIPAGLSPAAQAELQAALARLRQGPGAAARVAEVLGSVLGGAGRVALGLFGGWGARATLLMPGMDGVVRGVAERALGSAYAVAVVGLPPPGGPRTSGLGAGIGVAASGAAGGALGLAGFAPDAAVFTLALMRRIARIAAEEGEDLSADASRRACLEVFALRAGLPGDALPPGEAGYFSTRLLLQGGPLARLLAEAAARYGVQLGQKLAAQAVPVAGAACGAAVNAAFMAQYDSLARAHFTVRRLEREWGAQAVATASLIHI